MKRTKKFAEKIHARRRIMARHGIWMSKADHRQIVIDIQTRVARFLGRQTNRLTYWEVECKGQKIRVIYDSKRQCLVTCLPEHFKVALKGQPDEPPTNHDHDGSSKLDARRIDAAD